MLPRHSVTASTRLALQSVFVPDSNLKQCTSTMVLFHLYTASTGFICIINI